MKRQDKLLIFLAGLVVVSIVVNVQFWFLRLPLPLPILINGYLFNEGEALILLSVMCWAPRYKHPGSAWGLVLLNGFLCLSFNCWGVMSLMQ